MDNYILFILKNNETFLSNNIENIEKLKEKYNLLFVVREAKDRTEELLKTNSFNYLKLSYDSGYIEALKTGIQFIQISPHNAIMEFCPDSKIELKEIDRMFDIFYSNNEPIVFGNLHTKASAKKKTKLSKIKFYIYLSTFQKVKNPYLKFRIYNKSSLKHARTMFDNEIEDHNFIFLLYLSRGHFVEVNILSQKPKLKYRETKAIWKNKFRTFVYVVFVLPFIKVVVKNKCKI